jgi:cbb3-type cytochrome oxidase maturation protein
MSVILILILASLTMALIFLGGFIWSVRSGQYEDTVTPSMRILTDETTKAGRTLNPSTNETETNHERRNLQIRQ